MAFKIIDSCVNCWACEPLCPSQAILAAKPHFVIDAKKCTECEGDFAEPQCASICPIEGAILDASGLAVNPPGSLTGIPPERLAAARAEIRAR
ncbi:4Fe-4S binding protein [Imhoffiella purpurea]|uniref:4Fe-4S ferredoxin, nitrogenase-associated n=1 Tax=Imhoffiella purpurea TaxID=1249627 RepID=W9V864_9GAMM|nr:4Fe-4S binding protein [Imhoffiella purpurea]EXJ15768.1 4Fe-4S ferredoxin, nitrogenase-associated [Imhoffiella purpurea]